jgi:hypothetical protein
MENRLDGNAAAGVLQQIFPFETTTLKATCAGCRQVNVVGALVVYQHGMGTIVRCPSCDCVLIRVTEIDGCYWLDMHGVRVLRIPVQS